MSRRGELGKLRVELDEAITYRSRHEAMKLAREGLKEAKARGLLGEIEYFSGQIDILKERFIDAIEHFDLAIKYNSSDGASYNDRALCMVELGIIDEALKYFNKGIEVEPDFATIYHNKGWLLNNIGRHKEAIACFKQALALEPDRAVTFDNLADALYNLCDYKGAKDSYLKVLKLLGPSRCRSIQKEIKKKIIQIEGHLKKD